MWTRIADVHRMFEDMDLLQSRMSRFFGDYDRVPGYGGVFTGGELPLTNFYDTGDHFELKVELPGLAREDLTIKIQGNYLEISGRREAGALEGYTVHRSERGDVNFTRSFTLPAEVDADKVEATLAGGILTMILPKAEAAKPRQIAVQ
ncbi:MAG: Hsp20/alpha crystallin family protein [Deltaproteobacteria bacterium]|nr:Hsp20/alpha crystallin family protein [Deltaproteobacteria bacterium]